MRSRRVLPLVVAFVLAAAAGCGLPGSSDGSSSDAGASAAAGQTQLLAGHVHGIARHPGSGAAYVATHDGLFVLTESGPPRAVGPVVDLMGFTITEEGVLLASGHPGVGTQLPQPVGLIESTDGGKSWTVRSRGGESDFHALTSSDRGVLGYDGALRASVDRTTWRALAGSFDVGSLAASPDGRTVLATTSAGLQVSTTFGESWAPVPGAPSLVLVDWAGDRDVVGMDRAGRVFLSDDAGRTWTRSPGDPLGPPQAIGASVVDGGLEILAVTHAAILRSDDRGATFTALQ